LSYHKAIPKSFIANIFRIDVREFMVGSCSTLVKCCYMPGSCKTIGKCCVHKLTKYRYHSKFSQDFSSLNCSLAQIKCYI